MKKRIKVLEVISSLGPTGGGETFSVNLSRVLNDKVDLKVAILYRNNRDFFLERLKDKNIDFEILDKKRHFDLKNAKQLRGIIDEFQPDVIHTENNALIPVYLATRGLFSKRKIPVYHTMHLLPEKECSNKLVRVAYKYIFRQKRFVPVAIAERLSNATARFFHRKEVPYIENGTDLTNFKNTIPLQNRTFDIVVVGRFSEPKNHKFLLPAFSKMKSVKPDIRVALVGGGELFEEMKLLADKLQLGNNVSFLGVMNDPSIIVNDSKIIALGSLYEANPLVLLEGMGSGCVVISSSVGGVPDVVREPDNGFLFPPNDEQAFIDLVLRVLRDPMEFLKVSEYNSKNASVYSMDTCAEKYVMLFTKGLENAEI